MCPRFFMHSTVPVLTASSSSLLRVEQTTTAMRLSDAGRQHRILRPVPDEPKSKTQYMATDASSRLLLFPSPSFASGLLSRPAICCGLDFHSFVLPL